MPRPPQFDCPVQIIMAAPAMQTAPGTVYRCTLLLAVAYWNAECSLPVHDDLTLAAICRMQPHVVRAYKTAIIHALSQITPDLDKHRRKRVKAYEARYGLIVHATAVRDSKRADARLKTRLIVTDDLIAPATRHAATSRQGPAKHEATRADGSANYDKGRKGYAGHAPQPSSVVPGPATTFTD